MIEPFKIAKFLDELGISIEDYWLMYRIMINQGNYSSDILKIPKDINLIEFAQLSEKYQERFKDVNWSAKCRELEQLGYLEIWTQNAEIKLNEVQITEAFLQYFYITDIEDAFEQFIAIYPKQIKVENKKYSVYGKNSKDELIQMFKTYIIKGNNNILFARFMEITKLYLDDNDSNYAPYNIESYFKAFEGIAVMYEEQHKSELNLFNDDI